jgi:uncharacterized protein (TIGR02466 family)
LKIQDPVIETIFPTPVLHSFMKREPTETELAFFNEQGKVVIKNTGNWTSKNRYILDEPEMVEIKEMLMEAVDYWFKTVVCNSKVEPYITQSWLNWTQKEETHHLHNHPNSIVSGVLYINGEDDKLHFHKQEYEQIKILPDTDEQYNEYNCEVAWFSTPPGKILLFPSKIQHTVEKKVSDKLRVTLAFNVFVRGTIGKASALTELRLG